MAGYVAQALAAAIVGSLLASVPARAEESIVPDVELIRSEIAKHWNIVVELVEQCPEPFRLNITFKPGGVVETVTPSVEPHGKACRALVEAGRRAVKLSSPLPISSDISEMEMIFDPASALDLAK